MLLKVMLAVHAHHAASGAVGRTQQVTSRVIQCPWAAVVEGGVCSRTIDVGVLARRLHIKQHQVHVSLPYTAQTVVAASIVLGLAQSDRKDFNCFDPVDTRRSSPFKQEAPVVLQGAFSLPDLIGHLSDTCHMHTHTEA
jgi:hypothetical protein